VTSTVDFAPTWIRRYNLWAKVSALFCAGAMPFIAVVSRPGLPLDNEAVDNEAVTADAFGRVPPSSVPTTSIGLISASAIRDLGLPDERAGVVAGRFAPARLTTLIFRKLNESFIFGARARSLLIRSKSPWTGTFGPIHSCRDLLRRSGFEPVAGQR
jgi:hypothetical protein